MANCYTHTSLWLWIKDRYHFEGILSQVINMFLTRFGKFMNQFYLWMQLYCISQLLFDLTVVEFIWFNKIYAYVILRNWKGNVFHSSYQPRACVCVSRCRVHLQYTVSYFQWVYLELEYGMSVKFRIFTWLYWMTF